MKRFWGLVASLVLLFFSIEASACTTILVTKEASEDGSVIVAHSDDSELFDQRLVYVPAADHEPGSLRPVYYDASSLGDRPEYHGYELNRYVGTDRGPTYVDPNQPQSIPIGHIPQVAHTYAYFDGSYGIMNEHQLMFGECTDGTKLQPDPIPGKLIFYSAELSRVAAERCTKARQAVELIGQLIETYGYYGTGETLPIGDTEEGWVIEMAPSPEGEGGLWVAKKVPAGEIFVASNELRIREIDPNDPDMLYSKNLHEIAKQHGWWNPEEGKLDWLKTVSLGEYNHPYYSLRRVWRLQSRIAPSKAQIPEVKNGFTKKFPFSIKPDKKLSVRDVMSLYRDYYQDTEFDLSKGITAGPFGCPYRYPGPMDSKGDTGDPNAKKEGAWERPISIFRCGFSYICQARGWLPDPIGGLVWFGPDEPMSTCYVPFYVGVTSIAEPYYTCDTTTFSIKSAWWVFNFVANWAALKYSYMIKDIQQKQDDIELAEIESIKEMDQKALKVYETNPEEAREMLTEYCKNQANQVVKEWWDFAWSLVARYDDGYVNEPSKMSQEVGYPKDWYPKSKWSQGPTTYSSQEQVTSPTDYKNVIINLQQLLKNTPEFEQQINTVIKSQPQDSYWTGKTSDDFVKFFETWLEYNPLPDNPGKYIRIFDALANSNAGEVLFNNNIFSSWFIDFLNARGEYFKTEQSTVTLKTWIENPDIKIQDYIIPEGGYPNFEAFFLRKLKPGSRPISGKGDSSVLVSPADGQMHAIYTKNLEENFTVKRDVINIRQALNNSPYADRFIGGAMTDILLWFTDYHHFHAPISGKIVAMNEYPGSYNYNFSNPTWYNALAKHKRLCYIIDSEEFGLVAMIPVGFWGVGSIITERRVGDYVNKGEELGHFAYGGSSILLLFEPDAITFIPEVGKEPIPVQVNKQIGSANKKKE